MNEDQLRAFELAFAERMGQMANASCYTFWTQQSLSRPFNPPTLTELAPHMDPVPSEADVTFLRTNGIEPW